MTEEKRVLKRISIRKSRRGKNLPRQNTPKERAEPRGSSAEKKGSKSPKKKTWHLQPQQGGNRELGLEGARKI